MSILFVDDTDDGFGNAEIFASAMDSLGVEYSYFDAAGDAVSPDAETLGFFDLVIWTTAGDQDDLQIWAGEGEDNQAIIDYLLDGGKLWLTGLDFMFNRYISPDTFDVGEFPYDFLGITAYTGQSRVDDGGDGVPKIIPADTIIQNLNELDFIFPTLWYADAVVPREEAHIIYEMSGDESYPYNGKATGVLYETDEFTTLTYFFDMGVVSTVDKIVNNVEAVLAYFETGDPSSIINTAESRNAVLVYPNPVQEALYFKTSMELLDIKLVQVYNSQGQKVMENLGNADASIDVSMLPSGQYYIKVVNGLQPTIQSFTKI